ncbi:MAG TPA: hypothetical protein VLH79_14540 [Chthonomonadales bacterium]|nr:hypothetical protein [Chthonomonadales bacterium]
MLGPHRPQASLALAILCAGLLCCAMPQGAQTLPSFDLTRAAEASQWQATQHIASLSATREGLRIEIGGHDPFVTGPARDFPAGVPLRVRLRIRSDTTGTAQLFYFGPGQGPAEERSVHVAVRAGRWVEVRAPLPALGPGTRFRFDPPGTSGACVIASIRFEGAFIPRAPAWPRPTPPDLSSGALSLRSGDLQIAHQRDRLGAFAVRVRGEPMASGHNRPMIGYAVGRETRWIDAGATRATVTGGPGRIVATLNLRDRDGGSWRIRQTFTPGRVVGSAGAIHVVTELTVDRNRSALYLPALILVPGLGSFGATKNQALLPGLDYLDANEPSSSEKSIEGPGARRQVPDTMRITIPMMVVQARDRYVALAWRPAPNVCAVFDSPDRLLNTGAHVMGLLVPGSDGMVREEGSLLPYDALELRAGRPLTVRATIKGGAGASIVPALQQYVALNPLPPVPDTGMTRQSFARWIAAGWLDSRIREGDRYRHAFWAGLAAFAPQPAADVATWMEWAAAHVGDTALAERLRTAARAALALVPLAQRNGSGVGHVGYPVEALLFGGAIENVEAARSTARGQIARFEPDGGLPYRAQPGVIDFARTHWSREANGFAAPVVAQILEAAALSGDAAMRREGLRLLDALDRFDNQAPRGAQTWEIALHAPDIVASAHMVRAYLLGHELTGSRRHLERAIYWAWTGLPFVYLVDPADQRIGLYATIAVYGATTWRAPNWMGLPVQWCGLVYADALFRLARFDPAGPWRRLAEGIAASGVQQSWQPGDERDLMALLPDATELRSQLRRAPAINPGTVQACAIRLFGGPEVYDYRVFGEAVVHAPGAITGPLERDGVLRFTVQGWLGRPYDVLVSGLRSPPTVRVNGERVALGGPNRFVAEGGLLALRVEGTPTIEVETAP